MRGTKSLWASKNISTIAFTDAGPWAGFPHDKRTREARGSEHMARVEWIERKEMWVTKIPFIYWPIKIDGSQIMGYNCH